MKKILITLLIFIAFPLISNAASLDDDMSGDMTDMYKYSETFTNPHMGQEQITDEEFKKTVDSIKAKKQKKMRKKDKPLEGQSNKEFDEGNYIDEKAEGATILNVPLTLLNNDGNVLPMGFYKVIGKKEGKEVLLYLYQGHSLIAKIPAIETKHDFDQEDVNFIKILPYNQEKVKIIFGSIDFNAYTFVYIKP